MTILKPKKCLAIIGNFQKHGIDFSTNHFRVKITIPIKVKPFLAKVSMVDYFQTCSIWSALVEFDWSISLDFVYLHIF